MPAEPGFKSVRIAPQPGGLKWIDCATPHPKGLIHVKLYFDDDAVNGEVTLPPGVSGVFEWKGHRQPLKPGRNALLDDKSRREKLGDSVESPRSG